MDLSVEEQQLRHSLSKMEQDLRWKRALDVILILLALPFLLPLMFFLALLIRGVSKGPVLFRQERVGL